MENRKSNFSEWYNEIIDLAGLSDKRYPVKGMNVWLPYGLKIMQHIDTIIRRAVDSRGMQEVSFPLLITRDQLSVEFEHVAGFENEVFWVTRGGKQPLEVEMALRPTSEAAMYSMFPLWIRSHSDLPLRIYQIVNVYRYETKHTRSFIRIREIHFFEAHTAHRDYEDAERQMREYIDIWNEITDALCLPYRIDRRPDWDKFPGAMYTLAFDTVMPGGRTLQIGTIHQYGENFSRNYGIVYDDERGEHHYVSQTTFGMSERLLAAVIGIHGDDQGLILPPDIAPVQFIVVPIPSDRVDTLSFARDVASRASALGYRVRVDDRDNYTPGYKYNDWEMRGVPVRIEIGEREVSEGKVTLALRSIRGRRSFPLGEMQENLRKALADVKEEIMRRAREHFLSMTVELNDMKEARGKSGLVSTFWCGSKDCADALEREAELQVLGTVENEKKRGRCVVCGQDGLLTTVGRPY
ncbi:proline--tRNA ligase [Thermogymnomonas acidicola]|uniref:Proline--tRNA ligase n=1 Tax=Thermogymnomonas acidicola TaxID=399579 RepID=A0AA37BRW8_9ARCH|nr:proline--tRNA ligase [Thermogymnomonas acidicola]GGM75327.1 proline--tRNA ligase [Thermogymnomonas acidicola]